MPATDQPANHGGAARNGMRRVYMPGTLIIITAPSGAGKTTLVRGLLERDPQMHLSVSYTTRAPRPGEHDGREYHFVDVETFRTLRDRGEFLEWAEVHGNYYATSRVWLKEQIAAGRDILLEIDWQGAQQVRRSFADAVGVFVLPPSVEVLESRLRGRGTDSEDVIARRLLGARGEMRHVGEFDYVILNDDLQNAIDDLVAVVRASRLRYGRQRLRHQQYFDFLEQD
ncbi:Guanylate kinase [Azoarcus sp. Aa7]|nr:Guanylate kinase [Azoarcus sp. Aa7]